MNLDHTLTYVPVHAPKTDQAWCHVRPHEALQDVAPQGKGYRPGRNRAILRLLIDLIC